MDKSRCWVDIDLSAFKYNIENVRQILPAKTRIMVVVKADAYGHGAGPCGVYLQNQCQVTDFGVATVVEAEQLRAAGVTGNIILLGYADSGEWQLAHDLNTCLCVTDITEAHRLSKFGQQHQITLDVHVKVDTGMRRIGIDAQCPLETVVELYSLPNLNIKGTFSHLSCADSFLPADQEYTRMQKSRFDEYLAKVKQIGKEAGIKHLCASSGVLNYPEFQYDMVRLGFLAYGYMVGEVNETVAYRPVLSMKARVGLVKTLQAGQCISYGRIYTTASTCRIATVMAGYADGYPRQLSNCGYVLIHGQKAPIVGRVCMDQFMVDVTSIDNVAVEDVVTLIGADGKESITLNDICQLIDSIPSAVVTNITPRASRYYLS